MKNILIFRSVGLDNSRIISVLSEIYAIKAVSTLSEAREEISKQPPNAVICGETFSGAPVADFSAEIKICGAKLLTILSNGHSEPYDTVKNRIDDVIFSPFCDAELLTRLKALLSDDKAPEPKVFRNGQMTVDYETCRIFIDGRPLHLTMLEYKLLCLLSKSCGKAVSYNTILRELWQTPLGNEILSLRVFVNSIRKKIRSIGGQNDYIQTQTGVGYIMPIYN